MSGYFYALIFSKIGYSEKERFDKQVIDSAFKRIIESQTKNMDIHFVYAGIHYSLCVRQKLKSFILKGMKKFNMKKVMVTIIHMCRHRLITKERMLDCCNGKEFQKESVNDDLDSFVEDLCLGKEPNDEVYTYYLPQLTEEELDLVEQKDSDFMDTFTEEMNADVEKAEMAVSESDSKYVYGYGYRRTYTIKNSSKHKVSSCCSSQ